MVAPVTADGEAFVLLEAGRFSSFSFPERAQENIFVGLGGTSSSSAFRIDVIGEFAIKARDSTGKFVTFKVSVCWCFVPRVLSNCLCR